MCEEVQLGSPEGWLAVCHMHSPQRTTPRAVRVLDSPHSRWLWAGLGPALISVLWQKCASSGFKP